jgi:hypothetical protein
MVLHVVVGTLEHFLYGTLFRQRTDHSALTWLMGFKNFEERTARWIQCLQDTTSLPSTVKVRSTKMPILFPTAMPIRVQTLSKSRGEGISQAGASYCGRSSRRIGPSCHKDGSAEEAKHGANSGRKRQEWKDTAHCSPTYQGYWVQWKSLSVRDGVLERH